MVDSIDDPFSEFLNAKDKQELDTELSGSFDGIGAEVGKKDGKIVIIAPLANTPAQKAGIQPQDEILEVNGVTTYNMTPTDVVTKIRGKKGTPVEILIMRESFDKPKKLTIIRDTINIPSASVEILPNNIALLKIYNFYQPLSEQFARGLKTIQDNKAKGIIIDLRNDPGGYLDLYTEIGNYFFKKGSVLLIEDYKGYQQNQEYRAYRDGELKDMPTIILINGGTASAAEILAGALRDNRGIKLVGETSFGKGSVQELISLSGNNQIKLTIAH
jgi:carboxyl-terminal processing protease